jgi:CBS domain containing-hemolysin-like protein
LAVELEEDADEPELILESHLQIGMTLLNTLDQIHCQIDTASELVD